MFKCDGKLYFVWNVMSQGFYRSNIINPYNTRKFKDIGNKDENEIHFWHRCDEIKNVIKHVCDKNKDVRFLLQEVDKYLLDLLKGVFENGSTHDVKTAGLNEEGGRKNSCVIIYPKSKTTISSLERKNECIKESLQKSDSIRAYRYVAVQCDETLVVTVHVGLSGSFDEHVSRQSKIHTDMQQLKQNFSKFVVAGGFNTIFQQPPPPGLHRISGKESNGGNKTAHIVDYAFSSAPLSPVDVNRFIPQAYVHSCCSFTK